MGMLASEQRSLQHGSLPPMPRNASRQEPEATEPWRQPLIDGVVSTSGDCQQDSGKERSAGNEKDLLGVHACHPQL